MLPAWLLAQDQYTAPFLELSIGARQSAMGGAGGILNADASAFYWNPAGIGFNQKINLQFMHNWLFDGLAMLDYAGCALPLPMIDAVLAFNGIRQEIDDIPQFPELPETIQEQRDLIVSYKPPTFNYYDLALYVSFGKLIKKTIDLGWQYFIFPVEISLGANIKSIIQKMGKYSSNGIGFDAGAMVKVDATSLLTREWALGNIYVGIAFMDIANTSIKWDSKHSSKIYYNVRTSLGYEQPLNFIQSSCLVAFDINSKYDRKNIGLELTYRKFASLRTGLNEGNFTAGAGIKRWGGVIDYAFSMNNLGNTHTVGTGYEF
jgi:hypothetical protein